MTDKKKPPNGKSGYKNPPKHSRWEKGQSGNPRGGRKKLEPSRTGMQLRNDILDSMEEPVRVTVNGKMKMSTAFQAFVQRVRNKAINGDRHAGDLYFAWVCWAMDEHVRANPEITYAVESVHRTLNQKGSALDREAIKYLNKMHRSTRGKLPPSDDSSEE